MFNIGGQELLLILLILLIVFGAKKLPELARGMGLAIKEFQKSKDDPSDEKHATAADDVAAAPTIPRVDTAAGDGTVRPQPTRSSEPGSL
ncbi:MAG: twin-arginine translocase TatA/TatE family subunit [Verrucomicrobiota bacterium]|nr:twin-arginine translocase TatA/TatE family subunit [Verrucomicrobiota bacterium]